MVTTVTLAELQGELETDDIVLVEALGPQYYDEGHLPGAINIPHTEVEALAPALLPGKDANIVVYCANGPCRNSGLAARQLARLGYTHVRDYHEGKAEWVAAGLPLESGVKVVR